MSYEIKYSGTKREKYRNALADTRDFMGKERFNKIVDICVNDYLTQKPPARVHLHTVRVALSLMAGVQGLPAYAFARYTLEVARTRSF